MTTPKGNLCTMWRRASSRKITDQDSPAPTFVRFAPHAVRWAPSRYTCLSAHLAEPCHTLIRSHSRCAWKRRLCDNLQLHVRSPLPTLHIRTFPSSHVLCQYHTAITLQNHNALEDYHNQSRTFYIHLLHHPVISEHAIPANLMIHSILCDSQYR